MESLLLNKYRTLSVEARTNMIADAANYIGSNTFAALVRDLVPEDIDPKNKHNKSSIYFVCSQMAAYKEMPRLQGEIHAWLSKY